MLILVLVVILILVLVVILILALILPRSYSSPLLIIQVKREERSK